MEATPMPTTFADALCDERDEALYRAELADEANTEMRSLHRWHSDNRYRQTPGYACAECRARAERIWTKYQALARAHAERQKATAK